MDEIEGIFVRLTGDGSQYQQVLKESIQATKDAEEAIISVGNHIDGFGDQLSRWGELAVSAISLGRLKTFFMGSVFAFSEQENAAIKLNAILITNGRNVEQLTYRYNSMATAMQAATVTSDETTLALLAQAESFGLTAAAAEKAVKDAIGFAAINDGNASSYLRLTAALARGDAEMVKRMARMVPQLRGIQDETELMTKATKLAATGFATAERQAQTFTGSMKQLGNAINDVMETVGELTGKYLRPFVIMFRSLVDAFQALGPQTKEALISIFMVGAALASIGPLASVYKATLRPLFTMLDDGFRIAGRAVVYLLNPLNLLKLALHGIQAAAINVKKALVFAFSLKGLGLLAAIVAIATFIDYLGGFANAWDYVKAVAMATWDTIKQKAMDFWAWFKPIGKALAGAWSEVWHIIKIAALTTWEVIKEIAGSIVDLALKTGPVFLILKSLLNSYEIDWKRTRDVIIDSLLAVEYFLTHYKRTMEVIRAGVAYYLARHAQDYIYLFKEVVPAVLNWFARNWKNIFTDIFNWTTSFFKNMVHNQITVLRNLPGLLKGTISLADVDAMLRPLQQGAERITEELVIPARLETELENTLKKEWLKLADAQNENWQAFRERRRREIFKVAQDQQQGAIPEQLNEDVKNSRKAIEDLKAVLIYSAESLSRIMKHRDMVLGVRENTTPSRAVPASTPAAQSGTAESQRRQLRYIELIELHLREIRRQPGTPLNPAQLGP